VQRKARIGNIKELTMENRRCGKERNGYGRDKAPRARAQEDQGCGDGLPRRVYTFGHRGAESFMGRYLAIFPVPFEVPTEVCL